MFIKYNFDIKTHQPVYVLCDTNGTARMITTNICTAIKKVQEVK